MPGRGEKKKKNLFYPLSEKGIFSYLCVGRQKFSLFFVFSVLTLKHLKILLYISANVNGLILRGTAKS